MTLFYLSILETKWIYRSSLQFFIVSLQLGAQLWESETSEIIFRIYKKTNTHDYNLAVTNKYFYEKILKLKGTK